MDPELHRANGGGHFSTREASEERRLHRSQESAKTEPSGGESSAWGVVSKESHSHRVAHALGGFRDATYERFLRMPVAVVVVVVWLIGLALLSSCVLTLYTLGAWLVSVVVAG